MKKIALLCFCALFALAACDKPAPANPYQPIDISTKAAGYVKQGNAFAMEFLGKVEASTKEDYVLSPLSMQFLLGMILDGAKGQTATEICNVLGYGAGETAEVNQFCLNMMTQLPALDNQTTLKIANAIVVDQGWPLLETYKNDVAHYYDAEVTNMDFSDVEGSTRKINKWCSDHTNGLIPKVLDAVDPAMLAYLMNAIYFKSQWQQKFDKSLTSEEPFTDQAGTKAKVPMMKAQQEMYYTDGNSFQAALLPYGNGAFSMTVILPTGSVAEAVAELRQIEDWGGFTNSFSKREVDLWLPRFETKFHILLNDILSEMGMPSAFSGGAADFSGMSPAALRLSFVQQDAIIKVDEEGSEAAAVSMAGIEKNAMPGPGKPTVFHADHPFIYIISEKSSGAILFAGRYSGK
jgi:serpin B